MPVYLKEITDFSRLEGLESVLIVPCRFCPAASLAISRNAPYFQFLTRFLTTASYEQYLEEVKAGIEEMGIKADIFRSHLIHQFVICMWTSGRRKKLAHTAERYDALVVMGCETAVQTVHDSVKHTSCKVYKGMRSEGIMSIRPMFHLPCSISLELSAVIPFAYKPKDPEPWTSL